MTETEVKSIWQRALLLREGISNTTNAYRLWNGKGDGALGITIDTLGSALLVQLYQPDAESLLSTLVPLAEEVMRPGLVVLKRRTESAGEALQAVLPEVLRGDSSLARQQVTEYGARFAVDLLDSVNHGLFLDMRENRHMVASMARGRSVLNLFSYTCSFSVHCRLAGATTVVNADSNASILERGRVNYGINGLEIGKGEFFCGDAREYAAYARRKDRRFGMVILDPPTFARGKGGTWQVERELPKLLQDCFAILEAQGVLFVSTNCSTLGAQRLQHMVIEAARIEGRSIAQMEQRFQGSDFPGTGTMRESSLSAWLVHIN